MMGVLAMVGACLSSTAVAASLHSYRYSGKLYAVGCESASQCVVTAHSAHPAGTRVLVIRNGKVRRTMTPKDTDYGNNTAVSCPSQRGCVAALPTADGQGLVIATVDGAGRITAKRVGSPRGGHFNAVSCAALTVCELAGTGNGGIAIASWNGKRRGPVSYPTPPSLPGNSFGIGNDLPTVSCAGSECEVAFNYLLSGSYYQAFLVHLRSGSIDKSKWASGLAVSSLSCGTSHSCWAILTASDGSFGPRLGRIRDGVLGTPRPLSHPAIGLACWSLTCSAVGDDLITTFVSGHQSKVRSVPTARHLVEAGTGPHGVFAAVGSAKPSGSVLAISH